MANFTPLELVYLVCAIVGGAMFLFRTVLFFIGGGGGHGDFDGDFDGDIGDIDTVDAGMDVDIDGSGIDDVGDMDGGYLDSDISFKFLSLQGLTAFLTIFGLVGLTLFREFSSGMYLSLLGAGAGGLFTVFLISLIFKNANKLRSDGTLRIENAVGQHGDVYLTIPAGGTGKVNVVVQGALREFNAISKSSEDIKTGDKIQVIDVTSNNTLIVEKL
jgi:membrane protein implicated in regulation of membrane protease activity